MWVKLYVPFRFRVYLSSLLSYCQLWARMRGCLQGITQCDYNAIVKVALQLSVAEISNARNMIGNKVPTEAHLRKLSSLQTILLHLLHNTFPPVEKLAKLLMRSFASI